LDSCIPDSIDHDALTGLANRRRFARDYRAAPGHRLVMVTMMGANDYNRLLRAIGHDLADEFMRGAALRMRGELCDTQTLYHVALLSFAFICRTPDDDSALRGINAAFDHPIFCAGIPVMADIAIGLAPCESADPAFVLRAALAATQDCRAQSMAWAEYDPHSDQATQRGFLLLSALSLALSEPGQLALDYQPKYALATGRLTSAEALLRWRHPTLGMISPAEFIPMSESTTLIHALTDWVMDRALTQAAAWRDAGSPVRVAVNVSPRNLSRPGFARRTIERLAQRRLSSQALELEFTEGLLVVNDQVVLAELEQLRAAGIHIAIDDFGTGFANFSYITHLPADIIKIDKSFIQRIDEDERAAAVVQSIVELGHRLGYGVVAEGIETEKVYRMLAGWKCDEGQGFLMSRPLDAAAFAAVLAQPAPRYGLIAESRSGSRSRAEQLGLPHQNDR
jgi:EAL domain-containing protein (putative c-di-GMP-specific phosphodiesterase class I)/GGDEF domain-containing protein